MKKLLAFIPLLFTVHIFAQNLGAYPPSGKFTAEQDHQQMMDQLGELAWRQHDGGHIDAPNMNIFINWADGFMNYDVKKNR